jgi:2'-5' RNA ligase
MADDLDDTHDADDKNPQPRRRAGETALLVTVPEAEPLVGALRRRYDAAAGAGVPAHVTVLYPFLDVSRIDAGVIGALAALLARHEPFEVEFARCGRFPDVLFLAPEPAAPFVALTEAVAGRWPEAPPYAGKFDGSDPHLTVAYDREPVPYGPGTYDTVEAELRPGLPVRARVASVSLFVCDETERWHRRQVFPLGGDTGTPGS